MVDMVSVPKRSIREVFAEYAQRKRSSPQPTHPSKRQTTASSSRVAAKRDRPPSYESPRLACTKCGRSHAGECKMGVCFRCGKPGHIV